MVSGFLEMLVVSENYGSLEGSLEYRVYRYIISVCLHLICVPSFLETRASGYRTKHHKASRPSMGAFENC